MQTDSAPVRRGSRHVAQVGGSPSSDQTTSRSAGTRCRRGRRCEGFDQPSEPVRRHGGVGGRPPAALDALGEGAHDQRDEREPEPLEEPLQGALCVPDVGAVCGPKDDLCGVQPETTSSDAKKKTL